jgi:hypothetical protein
VSKKSKNCMGCDWSWQFMPSSRDIKLGNGEIRLLCVHPQSRFEVHGEVFPLSCTLMRDSKGLCAPRGRLFTPDRSQPDKEMREIPRPVARSVPVRQSPVPTNRQPYKVTS